MAEPIDLTAIREQAALVKTQGWAASHPIVPLADGVRALADEVERLTRERDDATDALAAYKAATGIVQQIGFVDEQNATIERLTRERATLRHAFGQEAIELRNRFAVAQARIAVLEKLRLQQAEDEVDREQTLCKALGCDDEGGIDVLIEKAVEHIKTLEGALHDYDQIDKSQSARIAELETQLSAWHAMFGTTQLMSALAAIAALEAKDQEIARLKEALFRRADLLSRLERKIDNTEATADWELDDERWEQRLHERMEAKDQRIAELANELRRLQATVCEEDFALIDSVLEEPTP